VPESVFNALRLITVTESYRQTSIQWRFIPLSWTKWSLLQAFWKRWTNERDSFNSVSSRLHYAVYRTATKNILPSIFLLCYKNMYLVHV